MGPAAPQTAVSSVFLLLDKLDVSLRTNGTAAIRDPRTTPLWHDISGISGYPANVADVSAAVLVDGALPYLSITVQSSTGQVFQTRCLVGLPVPVVGGFFAPGAPLGPPAYPANCASFTDESPPAP